MKLTTPSTTTMAFGVVVFIATLASWLYGESVGVDTTIVWTVAGPIIVALFVGHQLGATADAAKQAASQTNGLLDARITSAVAAALAARDAARTRQAQGDISSSTPPAPSTIVVTGSPDAAKTAELVQAGLRRSFDSPAE